MNDPDQSQTKDTESHSMDATCPTQSATPIESSSTTTPSLSFQRRANKDLTPAERTAKKLYKKHLRQRTRLRKYEQRIQQTKLRSDENAVQVAMQEWSDYMKELQTDPDSLLFHCSDWNDLATPSSTVTTSTGLAGNENDRSTELQQQQQLLPKSTNDLQPIHDRETQRVKDGREWIIDVYKTLVPKIMVCGVGRGKKQDIAARNEKNAIAANFRQEATIQARELLSNMQKGTQTEGMFNNDLALLGYTRQKFIERAVLAFKLLDRVDPSNRTQRQLEKEDKTEAPRNDLHSSNDVWEQLMSTDQVLSIGCGPGCDLVGVLGFFESHSKTFCDGDSSETNVSMDDGTKPPTILMLDYVMGQWKRLVLDQLMDLLKSREFISEHRVMMEQCDVRYSLVSNPNPDTRDVDTHNLKTSTVNEMALKSITRFCQHQPSSDTGQSSNRLIIVSYLLTETRHQWKDFFQDLLSMLTSRQQRGTTDGTPSQESVPSSNLLLLVEPTAWQLHDFLHFFGRDFIESYTWLDSSRDLPHLQALEARMGPAAILIRLK